jgi:hypothetical protein
MHETWKIFRYKLAGLVLEYVPLRLRRMPNTSLDYSIMSAVKEKKHLWKRAKSEREEMAK